LLTLEKLFLLRLFNKIRPLGHLFALFFIPVTWTIFAITDFHELGIYFSRLFPFTRYHLGGFHNSLDFLPYLTDYGQLMAVACILCTPFPTMLYQRFKKNIVTIFGLIAIFWYCIYQLSIAVSNPFLYFRF